MNEHLTDETVEKFLSRVMEIEENFAFTRKGQDSSRKEELRKLLDEFCG